MLTGAPSQPLKINMFLLDPYIEYEFMRRALIGCLVVCLGSVPTGIFVILRRMSLTGDAMAHAILPGVAIAYLLSGLSLIGLTIGGLLAGLIVALLSGFVARTTKLKEDTSLAAFYLISLALGVLIISAKDSNVDLFHVLFGNILALNNEALWLLATITSVSLICLAVLYRPLVIDCVDTNFLRRYNNASKIAHYGFLFLMVINLVAGFHALGTLMAIGIMILPAAASRFWANTLDSMLVVSMSIGFLACFIGLLLSFYFDFPAGPSIVLTLGVIYIQSLILGTNGGFLKRMSPHRHLTG